jgi:hypothetical protein
MDEPRAPLARAWSTCTDEDRRDPLKDVFPPPEADELGINDVAAPPAETSRAVGHAGSQDGAGAAQGQQAQPSGPAPDQRGTSGGVSLPNDGQGRGIDRVEESDLESFPANAPPAW